MHSATEIPPVYKFPMQSEYDGNKSRLIRMFLADRKDEKEYQIGYFDHDIKSFVIMTSTKAEQHIKKRVDANLIEQWNFIG